MMKKLLFIFAVTSLLLLVACQEKSSDESSVQPETVSIDYDKEVGINADEFIEVDSIDISDLDEMDQLDSELAELNEMEI